MQAMKSHKQEVRVSRAFSEYAFIPLGKHLQQPHKLSSSRVLIWKTCSGNGFRVKSWANPPPSLLLSLTLPNENDAHILSKSLAKIGHLAPTDPSYTLPSLPHACCSLWRLIIKVLWCPTPSSHAAYHWEPSGLMAKSQAHLPHPLTYWRAIVSSCFLLLQPQHDPYCYHSSMMLFHANSNHFPLTFSAPAFWNLHL